MSADGLFIGETPWFQQPSEDGLPEGRSSLAQHLQAAVDALERSPAEMARRQNILFCTELYMGRPLGDLYQLSMSGYDRNPNWDPEELTFNLVYAIVNTIRNRVCSFRPRAQFLPNGGDYQVQRGARDMTDISDAWAHKNKYQVEASLQFRDLLIGDGGVLKIDDAGDEVTLARFPEWEFLFDEVEGRYRKPECAYHVTYLPVEQAAEKYQLPVARLASASVSSPMGIVYGGSGRNQVRIIQAWKRGPDNGRTALIAGDCLIPGSDRPWKYDGWPLVINTFDEGQIGIWGTGAAAALVDLQLELNDVHAQIREGHRMSSMQRIAIQENDAAPTKITNAVVAIDRYKNAPPTYSTPAPVNAGWFQYADYLTKKGYETLGISPYIAAGVKQPGTTSALAIQESTELQQDRLALLSQMWETTVVDVGEWWRRLQGDLIREGRDAPSFRSVRRGAYHELAFPDPAAEFEIRVYPSSIFGSTVAGRLERANFLIDKGWLTREDAMRAADVPDLSPIIDLQLAQQYAMEKIVDDILEKGKYVTPPPYINAATLFAYARNRYLLAFASEANYPVTNMGQLSKLIDAIDPTKPLPGVAQAQLPAPADAMGQGAAVPGPTGAPPPGPPPGPQVPTGEPAAAPASMPQ